MTDAREQLHAALEIFEHLAARPWAQRAEAGVRATGAGSTRNVAVRTPHPAGERDRAARGIRADKQGDRRPPLPLAPHGERPPVPDLPEARDHLARGPPPALRDALQPPTESDDSRP
jgi:hypothetical protein